MKKTYNSIARSFRSKPNLSIFFFPKNGRQIKKLKQKPGERHPSRIFLQQQASLKYGSFEAEALGNIYFSVFDNKLRLLVIYRRKQAQQTCHKADT